MQSYMYMYMHMHDFVKQYHMKIIKTLHTVYRITTEPTAKDGNY